VYQVFVGKKGVVKGTAEKISKEGLKEGGGLEGGLEMEIPIYKGASRCVANQSSS